MWYGVQRLGFRAWADGYEVALGRAKVFCVLAFVKLFQRGPGGWDIQGIAKNCRTVLGWEVREVTTLPMALASVSPILQPPSAKRDGAKRIWGPGLCRVLMLGCKDQGGLKAQRFPTRALRLDSQLQNASRARSCTLLQPCLGASTVVAGFLNLKENPRLLMLHLPHVHAMPTEKPQAGDAF